MSLNNNGTLITRSIPYGPLTQLYKGTKLFIYILNTGFSNGGCDCEPFDGYPVKKVENIGGKNYCLFFEGAQWLSGRVLDSRPRGRRFEPRRRHCVVVIEQDTFILA